MRLLYIVPLLFSLTISGCHYGVQIEDFKPAHSPQGVKVELKLYPKIIKENTIAGELLEVRDDGLLLNVPMGPSHTAGKRHRVVFVAYTAIKSDDIEQTGRSDVAAKRLKATSAKPKKTAIKKDEEARRFLRLISRYPQGLSSELLAELLSAQGQEGVETLARD